MRALIFVVAGFASAVAAGWNLQTSGTTARFRGVSTVDAKVAWASGAKGTVVKTLDGGATWTRVAVPDSAGLDFRDIEAFDDRTCHVLSIGPGELSRIERTSDGGATWTVSHVNRDPRGFLDAIAFWNPDHGLALGDPVDGRYTILATDDGGRTWAKLPEVGMPPALPGEGAFAASGTCLVVQGERLAWFGTGGGEKARVFRSTDRGRTWAVAETPIRAGSPSRGVFSLAFRDDRHGLAVGGDYKAEADATAVLASTDDGGATWQPVPGPGPTGFRSAVAFVPGGEVVTVGPSGSDRSLDGGRTWTPLPPPGFHALSFGRGGTGWGVGEGGRIGKLTTNPPAR
jgi:photosystem II stability/assembly factor-like uncharacterized protein